MQAQQLVEGVLVAMYNCTCLVLSLVLSAEESVASTS